MRIVVGSDIPHYTRSVGQFDNRMSYVSCLQDMGHEVVVIADVRADRCLDTDHRPVPFADFHGRREFPVLAKPYANGFDYCLIYDGGRDTDGMSFDDAMAVAESSDVLLNIGGKLQTKEVLDRIACKVFIDLAPGKTQVYHDGYDLDQGFAQHDYFFTVGTNIGKPECVIPTCGLRWHGFLHPVPLSLWPPAVDSSNARFTTISGWMGKETFVLDGRYSGEKSDQWRVFRDLPRLTEQPLQIALNLPPGFDDDEKELRERGWGLSDPNALQDFFDYRRFLAESRAEFTVANQRYTEFRVGWFSERSARYLASGKPVVMQTTGIEQNLPTGQGLLTFATLDEAVTTLEEVNSDYEAHCLAARQIAEEHFDGKKVLARLLEVAAP